MKRIKETARQRLRRLHDKEEATWETPTCNLDSDGIRTRLWFAFMHGYELRRRDAKKGLR